MSRLNVSLLPVAAHHPAIFSANICLLDLALQVLDDVIMTRWKVLPREQCQGMDNRLE